MSPPGRPRASGGPPRAPGAAAPGIPARGSRNPSTAPRPRSRCPRAARGPRASRSRVESSPATTSPAPWCASCALPARVSDYTRGRPRRRQGRNEGRNPAMTVRSKNHDWLALTVEDPLDPDLPICDPHHHLWDLQPARVAPRYLLDEIVADVGAGHNVVSTVFIECGAMFKKDGPEALRPVGETEFVNGIAAMSASGLYGKTRIAAGIVGTASLRLGDAVAAVLDAQMAAGGGRFRGIRLGAAWDSNESVPSHRTKPGAGLLLRDDFRAGVAHLAPRKLTFEAWRYHDP